MAGIADGADMAHIVGMADMACVANMTAMADMAATWHTCPMWWICHMWEIQDVRGIWDISAEPGGDADATDPAETVCLKRARFARSSQQTRPRRRKVVPSKSSPELVRQPRPQYISSNSFRGHMVLSFQRWVKLGFCATLGRNGCFPPEFSTLPRI